MCIIFRCDLSLFLPDPGGRPRKGFVGRLVGWSVCDVFLSSDDKYPSVWSKVFTFGTHIRHLERSHWAKYYFDWPDGGAIETVQSCELWKAVSQAPYVVQTWNFAHLCLSSQRTNLPQEPISSAYLDFPPFWIYWKTPKNLLKILKIQNGQSMTDQSSVKSKVGVA